MSTSTSLTDIIRQQLGGGGVHPDAMSQTFRRLRVSMTDDDALDIAKEIAAALRAAPAAKTSVFHTTHDGTIDGHPGRREDCRICPPARDRSMVGEVVTQAATSGEMRRAAVLMREQHGPEHERHEMWVAMADLLDYTAKEHERHACGLALVGHAVDAARAYLAAPGDAS